jgi:hypothetical protein
VISRLEPFQKTEKMNRNLISIFISGKVRFFLAGILLIFAAANSTPAQIETEIVKIRAEVAAINKGASKYAKKTKDLEGISLEGTRATYFLSAENLKKITAEIYGETYRATGEFYYTGSELIFAYLKHHQYDTQIGASKSPKVVRTEEQRYYFVGGELIRLLIGKKELKSGDEKHSQLKEEIISLSSKLKDSQ